jgi:hypothetical protein
MQGPYKIPAAGSIYNSYASLGAIDTRAFDKYQNPHGAAPASMLDLSSMRSTGVDYTQYSNYLLDSAPGLSRISGLPQDYGLRTYYAPVGPSPFAGVLQQTRSDPYAPRASEKITRQMN